MPTLNLVISKSVNTKPFSSSQSKKTPPKSRSFYGERAYLRQLSRFCCIALLRPEVAFPGGLAFSRSEKQRRQPLRREAAASPPARSSAAARDAGLRTRGAFGRGQRGSFSTTTCFSAKKKLPSNRELRIIDQNSLMSCSCCTYSCLYLCKRTSQ